MTDDRPPQFPRCEPRLLERAARAIQDSEQAICRSRLVVKDARDVITKTVDLCLRQERSTSVAPE